MRYFCTVIALLATTASLVAGQAQTFPLDPFTAISVCTPFNVLIQPSTDGTYAVVIDADAGVAAATNASVVGGVLTLSSSGGAPTTLAFQAANAIKIAVQLPADQLASVAVSSVPAILVAIAPGFAVPAFSASVSGTSTLSALSLQATDVQVVNAGTGSLYLAGAFTTATITSSGTGSTYLIGVTTSAAVDASGISNVFISGAATLQITGQVSGISSVQYDQGICTITSEFGGIFGSPCNQAPIAPPTSFTTPQWSCAITVYGSFGCAAAAAAGGTTPSGPSTTASSASAGGGNGVTQTSSTINGVTQTSSSSSSGGPAGTSTLVTNTGTLQTGACSITGTALNMLAA